MSKLAPTLWFTAILLSATSVFSQSEKPPKDFSIFGFGQKKHRVIYAKENDGLPDKINAKGEIVDTSIYTEYCGIVGTGGTLKIKLTEKIENYNYDYLCVVVLCVAGKENENLMGKSFEIEVRKMTKYPFSFQVGLSNPLDSKGIPFYLSTVDGVGGLIERLKNKSSKKAK
jgi:hypothetical protein